MHVDRIGNPGRSLLGPAPPGGGARGPPLGDLSLSLSLSQVLKRKQWRSSRRYRDAPIITGEGVLRLTALSLSLPPKVTKIRCF